MSPEQAAGAKVDHRSDIYAAAAVIYEMFSGSQHVSAGRETEFRTRQRIVDGEFSFPGRQLPDALRHALEWALAKAPRRRPESAEALLELVEGAVTGGGAPAGGPTSRADNFPAPTRRRRPDLAPS